MGPDPSLHADPGGAPPAVEHEQAIDTKALPVVRTRSIALALLALACVFAAAFLIGWIPRRERLRALEVSTAAEDGRPPVDAGPPKPEPMSTDLRLPADVRSMQTTSIYVRANGFLKSIHADIGDRVEEGALLAEIDTPDVDAEVARAAASVELAKANEAIAREGLALADATLKRYTGLADTGAVTQQVLDERRAAFTQAKLSLEAGKASRALAEADLERLTVLQGFEKVAAPFAGTISARQYDVGALLTPANATEGRELYRIDRTDTLRVFVNVPQAYATQVKTGQKAALTVRNFPEREFAGTVVRSTGVVDPATRSLRMEIHVPNGDGALFSGMYGEVRLPISNEHPPLVVATSSLVFGPEGTFVWVLEGDRVHKRPVVVGRDLGTELEVVSGLEAADVVVKNPGERLVEGLQVQPSGAKTGEHASR